MDSLKDWGVHYISKREIKPGDAVMFDIDNTLIYTSGTPITPMIELLHTAYKLGYKIVIITARPGISPTIHWTTNQLKNHGIYYDYLGFTSANTKILMKNKLPYNFILSVGDMPTDLSGSQHVLNTSNFYHS